MVVTSDYTEAMEALESLAETTGVSMAIIAPIILGFVVVGMLMTVAWWAFYVKHLCSFVLDKLMEEDN